MYEVLLLPCLILLLNTACSSFNSPVTQSLLEAIRREWESNDAIATTASYEELESCLGTLKQFQDSTREEIGRMLAGNGLALSPVCNTSINIWDSGAVINFCNSLSFIQNVSETLDRIHGIQEIRSNLISVSFTDSLGEYEISFNLSEDVSGTNSRTSESSGPNGISPFCIADPRLDQRFITTVTNSKLLVILNLVNDYTSQPAITIQGIIRTVISYRQDFVAYLSRGTINNYHSINFTSFIQRANHTNIATLVNLASNAPDFNETAAGYDWVNLHTLFNLLTRNLSSGLEPCNRVLAIVMDRGCDLSDGVTDTLLQAMSTNLQFSVFIYSLADSSSQNYTSGSLANIDRLLCEGRTLYKEVRGSNEHASFETILDALSLKAADSSTQDVSLFPGLESDLACISLYRKNPVFPGHLQSLAGVICLEMISSADSEPIMDDPLRCTNVNPTSYEQNCGLKLLRQRGRMQLMPSTNSSCPSEMCSQNLSPLQNYTKPILDHLSSLLVLSSTLVMTDGFLTNEGTCEGKWSQSSCFSTGWTQPSINIAQSLHLKIPFSFQYSSFFFVNSRSLEEEQMRIQTEQGLNTSLCASSYLDSEWRMLTYLVPELSFQYFDYEFGYVRSYPGYQANNESCATGKYSDFVSPGNETMDTIISELTGRNVTRYCRPVNSASRTTDRIGLLCVSAPLSMTTSVPLEEPVAASTSPSMTYPSTSQMAKGIPTPSSIITELPELQPESEFDINPSTLLEESIGGRASSTSNMIPMTSLEFYSSSTSLTLDSLTPTPMMASSEAEEFRMEVEHYLKSVSKRMKYAYQNLTILDKTVSCPYGNQLNDSCEVSCSMEGSGADVCRYIFGDCRKREDGNLIYASNLLSVTLDHANYSLDNIRNLSKVDFKRLCMTQSLFAEDAREDYGTTLFGQIPSSVYYIDSYSGFVSSLPTSDCSAHGSVNNCEDRRFNARDSAFYSRLLWGLRDIYIIVNINDQSNFNVTKNILIELASLIPENILKAVFFQGDKAMDNFIGFISNQHYVHGNFFQTNIKKALGMINNVRRTASIFLLTDSCLSNDIVDVFSNICEDCDVFTYLVLDSCVNPVQARKLSCMYSGEWRRVNEVRNSNFHVEEQNSILAAVNSYFRFHSTSFALQNEQILWTDMGMELDSDENENTAISACIPVLHSSMTCQQSCLKDQNLLGLTCMEFDRSRIQALEDGDLVIQRVINQNRSLLNATMLNDEVREDLRINKCNVSPRVTTPTGSSRTEPSSGRDSPNIFPSTTRRPTIGRRRLTGGYVAAIILGAVAMISGSICVGYWTITLWTEYHKKRRPYYKSSEGNEEDPFSTNYKKLHENMTKEDQ